MSFVKLRVLRGSLVFLLYRETRPRPSRHLLFRDHTPSFILNIVINLRDTWIDEKAES
jgi:hypothetical protein